MNKNIVEAANNNLSVLELIFSSDLISKSVMLILIIFSVWSWAMLFEKYFKFKRLLKKMSNFESLFWSGQVLDHLYEKVKLKADHVLSLIFVSAINEWRREAKSSIGKRDDLGLRLGVKERILKTMDLIRNKETERLEEGMSFLATVSSASPFIGLFGTVWGIMNSFQSIATSKNTTLAVVAPGIAEALLATAIGLFAAIPALIFYNYLSAQLNIINNRVDDFIAELYNLVSRSIDEEKD